MRTFNVADWVWDKRGREAAARVALMSFKRAEDVHGVKLSPMRHVPMPEAEAPDWVLEHARKLLQECPHCYFPPVFMFYEADVIQ